MSAAAGHATREGQQAATIGVGVRMRAGKDYVADLGRAFDHYHRGALTDAMELASLIAPNLPEHDRHARGLVTFLDANIAARRSGCFPDDTAEGVAPEAPTVSGEEASERYHAAAAIVADDFSDGDPRLAAVYLNHGVLNLAHGRLDDAERYLGACLTLLSRCFNEEHVLAADAHHNLGALFEARDDADRAKSHYVQSLKIRSRFDDSRHAVDAALIETMTNVAMLAWRSDGDAAECLRQLQRALPLARRLPKRADTDLTLAAVLTHCGAAALALGSASKAAGFLSQAHPLRASRLGKDHPETVAVADLWQHARAAAKAQRP